MNTTIIFTIKNRRISSDTKNIDLIGDNMDYTAVFDLDEDLAFERIKTARFIKDDVQEERILDDNNSCQIPPELLKKGYISVGVYTDKKSTTPCFLQINRSIRETDYPAKDPEPDVYRQLLEKIEKLKGLREIELRADEKNIQWRYVGEEEWQELISFSDIIVSPEEIKKIIEDYFADNPLKETDPTVPDWAKEPQKPTYTAEEVGALPTSKLPEAIDVALAQAKASGEFNGKDGKDGTPGEKGDPGPKGDPGETTYVENPYDDTKVREDIGQLKEDISNKITKFYASSQGETHLTDSDNGKIQDMMIYGKSSQDGTPTPENPVEIKSVVNPTVKVCGKNLWDNFKTLSLGNVEQKNGTYIATTDTIQVDTTSESVGFRPLPLKANNTYTFSLKTTVSISSYRFVCLRYTNGENKNISFVNKNFVNFVPERDVEKIGFILYGSVAGDKVYDAQLEMGSEATSYEPYHEQTVALPYTLNAIPVSSDGNVTINGQQYIADYVDVERGKVVRMCERETFNTKNGIINEEYRLSIDVNISAQNDGSKECIFSTFEWTSWTTCVVGTKLYIKNIKKPNNELYTAQELKELGLDFDAVYQLAEQQETDLTTEQTQALKELVTYYPVTNISVNSEQLDGYTVFNYPISMANGWNYVKQQLNDNRDYIYDMDLQSAEAYVNSEYAVALTELEV